MSEPPLPAASTDEYEEAASLEEGMPLIPKEVRFLPEDSPELESTKSNSLPEPEMTKRASIRIREAASSVMHYASEVTIQQPVFGTSDDNKLLCYDHDTLLTSRALMLVGASVFAQKPVLYTLAYCSLVAVIAALAVFFIPMASKMDTTKFDEFGNFLKFFIVFMLGIYVQQAFKRWWWTVTTFEKILIGVRQLVFMLHTIRATPESRKKVEAYCIASGYILNIEVRNTQIVDKRRHVDLEKVCTWLVAQGMLSEKEVGQLRQNTVGSLCKTRAIWSWIGELVSHPQVEEGYNVLPPLLVRTLMMCQGCISEIESLKMNITMQTPFMYAQLLAILVHVNNFILSVSCGMTLGSSMSEIRRRKEQLSAETLSHHRDMTLTAEFYEAIQTVGVQLVIVLLSPMLYIAFLHIAHILCYPFGDESHHLPTETLIERLHGELNDMSRNREYFRKEHAEYKVSEQAKIGDKKGLKDADDDDDDGGGDI